MADLRQAIESINAASTTKIGPRTVLSGPAGNEIVEVSPLVLAEAAKLDPEIYALGRAIQSEEGNADGATLLAVAEAIRNRARYLASKGKDGSILSLVTYDPDKTQSGKFGRQAGGRYVATSQDPTERSIQAARVALDQGTNIAGGAMRFFAPHTQDKGLQAGKELKHDAIDLVKKWGADGYRWVRGAPLYQMFQVNPYHFMLLGIPSMVDRNLLALLGETIQTITRGRAGLPPPKAPPPVA